MREDIYKNNISADKVPERLPYAIDTALVELRGWKRFELNTYPKLLDPQSLFLWFVPYVKVKPIPLFPSSQVQWSHRRNIGLHYAELLPADTRPVLWILGDLRARKRKLQPVEPAW